MVKKAQTSLLNLADEIGAFIQYWGFKKVHGRIWCLIFLSEKPIDANYLINNLGVSKALISMTIKDLLYYKVIEEAPKTGPTICYIPNVKIKDVIFDVLLQRETKMLLKIKAAVEILERSNASQENNEINEKRITQVKKMTNSADFALKSLMSLNGVNLLPLFNKLNFKE